MTAEQAWGDERLTTVGLLFESTTALGRIFEPQLSADSGLSHQSFDVLVRLARTPGYRLRMSELASQTSLTPSGLTCLLYTSPSPRDRTRSRMPSSA